MKRYKIRCHDCDPEIIPHDTGKWVRYTDVERLRAELAACREDAEKWRAYAARKRAVIDAGMGKIILRDAARKGEGE